jgi:hypothetical protein
VGREFGLRLGSNACVMSGVDIDWEQAVRERARSRYGRNSFFTEKTIPKFHGKIL